MINYYKSLKQILYQDLNIKPIIPTSDDMAIKLYPEYKIFYNKKYLSEIQGIKHGFNKSNKYPVVIKPFKNLIGGSKGFRIISNSNEFKLYDGDFWMELLTGEHLCIDIFILEGKIKFYTILKSKAATKGTFEYHESMPEYKLSSKIKKFIFQHFSNYTGILNCETINEKIIDLHLRPNGDFYLYNNDVVQQIINLYFNQKWELKNYKIPKMFLFPIFIEHDKIFEIDIGKIIKILEKNKCNNLMLKQKLESPGGNRIFMYSSQNFEDGNNARNEILRIIKYKNIKLKYYLIIFLFIVLIIFIYYGKIN
jgi:hypothetical protein